MDNSRVRSTFSSLPSHPFLVGEYYNKYTDISSDYVDAASMKVLTAFFPEEHFTYKPGPNTTYTNDFVVGEVFRAIKYMDIPQIRYRKRFMSGTPFFGDKPVLVLTNGVCFSSCAIFTHVLKSHFGLQVVTVGGIPNEPMPISASCLGFSKLSLNDEILQNAQNLGLKNYPPPFQVKVDLGYAASAMYVNSNVPCEFVYLAPDHRIFYDTYNVYDFVRLWEEAAQHFPDKGMPLKNEYL